MLSTNALRRLPSSVLSVRRLALPRSSVPVRQHTLSSRSPPSSQGSRNVDHTLAQLSTAVVALGLAGNSVVTSRMANSDIEEEGRIFVNNGFTSPGHLRSGSVHTLLTSSFTSATNTESLLDIGSVLVFGSGVARTIGAARFLRTYAMCGMASAFVGVASIQRHKENKPIYGAAGAVNAIVVLNTALSPRASKAAFVYVLLRTLEWGFFSHDGMDSDSRHLGHASGVLWGALCAVNLREASVSSTKSRQQVQSVNKNGNATS